MANLKTKVPAPRARKESHAKKAKQKAEESQGRILTPYELCKFWHTKFAQRFPGIKKDNYRSPMKDQALMGHLANEFPQKRLLQMIGWFIHNSEKIKGYSGAPTIGGFYGFRETVSLMMDNKIKTGQRRDSSHKRDSVRDPGVARL